MDCIDPGLSMMYTIGLVGCSTAADILFRYIARFPCSKQFLDLRLQFRKRDIPDNYDSRIVRFDPGIVEFNHIRNRQFRN